MVLKRILRKTKSAGKMAYHSIFNNKNTNVYKEMALYYMRRNRWNKAVKYWDKAYTSEKMKLSSKDYLQYAKSLSKSKVNKNATQVILKKGLKTYPNDEKLALALTDILFKGKQWQEGTNQLQPFIEYGNPSVKTYVKLADGFLKQGLLDKAESTIAAGVEKYPESKTLINRYIEIAIQRKNWEAAINRMTLLLTGSANLLPFENMIKQMMLYQLVGDNDLSKKTWGDLQRTHPDKITKDKKGYRKMVIYDNGESRIEFYKNLKTVERVIITFDSLYMNWNELPFGFKLLIRQDVDIIAVRKRLKGTSQQDLSQNDFVECVSKVVSGYNDKIAYGHSLGGYTSLYYASIINCRILSLAPRLSIHPLYGKKSLDKSEFKHNISHEFNDNISPIIVYDPKEKRDNAYVKNELLMSYPNARLIKVPYGGHGIARHLLNMGVLKEYILKVIDKEMPKYDRRLKSKSANYFWVLGRASMKRNKLTWAESLAERSVSLAPTNRHAVKFKFDILKKLARHADALDYVKKAVDLKPKSMNIRLLLIDAYIMVNDLVSAEKEINLAYKIFKNTKELDKRHKQLIQKNKVETIKLSDVKVMEN